MNVLLFSSRSPFDEITPAISAGAEIAMRRIAERLAERGHGVHYLSLHDGPRTSQRLAGVHAHLVPRPATPRGPGRRLARLVTKTLAERLERVPPGTAARERRARLRSLLVWAGHRSWGLVRELERLVVEHDVDVLHCYSSHPDALAAALVAERLRVPLVLRMGGRFWALRHDRIDRPAKRLEDLEQVRFVFAATDCLAYNSRVVMDETHALFERFGVLTDALETVLDIGVEAPPPDSAPDPTAGFEIDGAFVAACVGKCKEGSKRQDLVLEAVARLAGDVPIRLFFAGGGPTRPALEARARELGVADRVAFLGAVPNASVHVLLARSHVLVHATEFEGASKAVAEAMLGGRAVVASDIPAMRELVTDGETGLLVPNDAEAIAAALRALWQDPGLRDRLGAGARAHARRVFDSRRNVEQYEELFRILVEQPRSRPKRRPSPASAALEVVERLLRGRIPRRRRKRFATTTEWRAMERLGLGRRRREDPGRLAYFCDEPDAEFWDRHWRGRLSPGRYRNAGQGRLGEYEDVFTRVLPRRGRILEAGCGPGHLVLALRARGYDCEGVDYGERTVREVHRLHPEVPIRVGDVTALDVPDGRYAAYVSLGVIEHRRAGPEPFLTEAWRVLADGGVAIFSVPHFHALRRLKARLGLFAREVGDREFYQYAYSGPELRRLLAGAGFEVLEEHHWNAVKGLADELPGLGTYVREFLYGPALNRWLKKRRLLNRWCGHKLLFVCRKPAPAGARGAEGATPSAPAAQAPSRSETA